MSVENGSHGPNGDVQKLGTAEWWNTVSATGGSATSVEVAPVVAPAEAPMGVAAMGAPVEAAPVAPAEAPELSAAPEVGEVAPVSTESRLGRFAARLADVRTASSERAEGVEVSPRVDAMFERGRARREAAVSRFEKRFAPMRRKISDAARSGKRAVVSAARSTGRFASDAASAGRELVYAAPDAVLGAVDMAAEATARTARKAYREARYQVEAAPVRVASRVDELRAGGRMVAAAVAGAREKNSGYWLDRSAKRASAGDAVTGEGKGSKVVKAERLATETTGHFEAAQAAIDPKTGTGVDVKTAAKEAAKGFAKGLRTRLADRGVKRHTARMQRRATNHSVRVGNTDNHAFQAQEHAFKSRNRRWGKDLGATSASRKIAGSDTARRGYRERARRARASRP